MTTMTTTGTPHAAARLGQVAGAVEEGYQAALEHAGLESLVALLDQVEPERRGFAYEGAAMALAYLDATEPEGGPRLAELVAGPGQRYAELVYAGEGMALASAQQPPPRIARDDPFMRCVVLDGYGFALGLGDQDRYLLAHDVPLDLSAAEGRVLDHGLGRALWFIGQAQPGVVADLLVAFPPARHRDLWAGLGMAVALAGATNVDGLNVLRTRAGKHRAHLGVGTLLAAMARDGGGNPAAHTDLACRVLAGHPASDALVLATKGLADLDAPGGPDGADGADGAGGAGGHVLYRYLSARDRVAELLAAEQPDDDRPGGSPA